MSTNRKSDLASFLRKVPGYDFFHEALSTSEELDAERFAPELELEDKFFSAIESIGSLPQVQELIEAYREAQKTDSPVQDVDRFVEPILKYVRTFSQRFLSKFRPEVLQEMHRHHSEVLFPTRITEYVEKVEGAAKLLQRGKLGVPFFLKLLGIPSSVFNRRGSLSVEVAQAMAKRIAQKKQASESPAKRERTLSRMA